MFKRLFLVIILFYCSASANTEEVSVRYEVKIIERIVLDITNKPNPKVCVIEYPLSYIYKFATSLQITSCNQADVVVSSTDKYISQDKPIILVGFFPTKDDDIIGAIFWRKGRPQIIFIERNIKKFHINLPEDYKKFLINRVETGYVRSDY